MLRLIMVILVAAVAYSFGVDAVRGPQSDSPFAPASDAKMGKIGEYAYTAGKEARHVSTKAGHAVAGMMKDAAHSKDD